MLRSVFSLLFTIALSACTSFPPQCGGKTTVEIKRDSFGVPHVFATNQQDLAFGYGYVLAEDRLYQLEMLRRSSQGTVSEVLGAEYLAFDKQQRSLFWPDDIRRQIEATNSEYRLVFQGMAEGINRRVRETIRYKHELLPYEFIEGEFLPSEWNEFDIVMLYVGTMLLRYGDFNTELENLTFLYDLEKQHGRDAAWAIFNDVMPRQDKASPKTIRDREQSRNPLRLDSLSYPEFVKSAVLGQPKKTSGFSNVLLVNGPRLEKAESVLINGPQFGWYVPGYTYSIGLHGPDQSIVGNAPVGYPFVMFGHNEYIAWGSTWGASDVVDIFELRTNPDAPNAYWYKGDWVELDSRLESIAVRNAPAVEVPLYRSRYGPIIRRVEKENTAYAKKRAWAGREVENLTAWMDITHAKNHKDWRRAAYRSSINVNLYFASRDGDIAYIAGGSYPKRSRGHDNRLPVLGDGTRDWLGFKDPKTNPQVLNPKSGYIANWNNKPGFGILNPDVWWYSWTAADRVEILDKLVNVPDALTPDDVWALMMKASYIDPNASYFLAELMQALNSDGAPRAQEVLNALRRWDNTFDRRTADGSFNDGGARYIDPAVAIFRVWLRYAMQITLGDDLSGSTGKALASNHGYGTPESPTAAGLNITVGLKLLHDAAEGKTKFDYFNGRDKNDVWREAFHKAYTELETTYGADLSDWQLEVPATRLKSSNFMGIPQSRPSAQSDILHEMNRGTENNMIVFGDGKLIAAYEIAPPGQSGFVTPDGQLSQHYNDQITLFADHGRRELHGRYSNSEWKSVKYLTLSSAETPK